MRVEEPIYTCLSKNKNSFSIQEGPVLCLSGGGFRAALFHLGAIRRLNQLGILSKLQAISSVSGGSILNGLLASRWDQLIQNKDNVFINFDEIIAHPLYRFCSNDIRTPLVIGTRLNLCKWKGFLKHFGSVSANTLADFYKPLFDNIKLSDICESNNEISPRFIFCATTMQTGACWQFHCGTNAKMGDFYCGYIPVRDVLLADAVAASSAFPGAVSAFRLNVDPKRFDRIDPWGFEQPISKKRDQFVIENKCKIFLTDGGVYDNLGIEPVWDRYNCLLVSDAGFPFYSTDFQKQDIVSRLKRVSSISMEQVGAIRKRWLIDRYCKGDRKGTFWSINTPIEDYPLVDRSGYQGQSVKLFNSIRTDLNAFSDGEMKCLENHGYSLTDAAIRSRALEYCLEPNAPYVWPHDKWIDEEQLIKALRLSGQRRVFFDLSKWIIRKLNFNNL